MKHGDPFGGLRHYGNEIIAAKPTHFTSILSRSDRDAHSGPDLSAGCPGSQLQIMLPIGVHRWRARAPDTPAGLRMIPIR